MPSGIVGERISFLRNIVFGGRYYGSLAHILNNRILSTFNNAAARSYIVYGSTISVMKITYRFIVKNRFIGFSWELNPTRYTDGASSGHAFLFVFFFNGMGKLASVGFQAGHLPSHGLQKGMVCDGRH